MFCLREFGIYSGKSWCWEKVCRFRLRTGALRLTGGACGRHKVFEVKPCGVGWGGSGSGHITARAEGSQKTMGWGHCREPYSSHVLYLLIFLNLLFFIFKVFLYGILHEFACHPCSGAKLHFFLLVTLHFERVTLLQQKWI